MKQAPVNHFLKYLCVLPLSLMVSACQMPMHHTVAVSIVDFGAVADGETLNTKSIQSAIDHCAEMGGGKVIVPKGDFLTGALFVKPGVDIELAEGGILKVSSISWDFSTLRNVRFVGHFLEHAVSLLIVFLC